MTLKKERSSLNAKLTNPLTRQATLLELAEWVKDTCLLFGTSAYMAFKIADMFTYGIEREVPVNEN